MLAAQLSSALALLIFIEGQVSEVKWGPELSVSGVLLLPLACRSRTCAPQHQHLLLHPAQGMRGAKRTASRGLQGSLGTGGSCRYAWIKNTTRGSEPAGIKEEQQEGAAPRASRRASPLGCSGPVQSTNSLASLADAMQICRRLLPCLRPAIQPGQENKRTRNPRIRRG